MALTQADIDALDRAIVASELEVEMSDGTRVKYRSVHELKEARIHAASVVAAAAGQAGAVFRFRMTTSRE